MEGPEHAILGAFIGAILAVILWLPPLEALIAISFCIFGTLLPDIDIWSSELRLFSELWVPALLGILILTNFEEIGFALVLWLILSAAWTAALYFRVLKHRGITHKWLTLYTLGAAFFGFTEAEETLFFLTGYALHLIIDKEFKLW